MAFYNSKKSQVVMLGGRRSGKSSILATIVYSLEHETRGDLFSVKKTECVEEDGGLGAQLYEKIRELSGFINSPLRKIKNSQFIVDMTPNSGRSTYSIYTSINGKKDAVFEFLDVPGEDMQEKIYDDEKGCEVHNDKFDTLLSKVKNSDVIVIAIDTPYLMETDENTNDIYNRVSEIRKLCSSIEPSNDKDKRLIILCPVKCEKYVLHGMANEVTEKVCVAYKDLINILVGKEVDIWVMPIQTAGGIEFANMMDASICYSNGKKTGDLGSIIKKTNQFVKRTGATTNLSFFDDPFDEEEDGKVKMWQEGKDSRGNNVKLWLNPDKYYISGTTIPLAWYRTNSAGFAPALCEQPAYHIIRFLSNKAYLNRSLWEKFKDLFGKNLNDYLQLAKQMTEEGLIKEDGDGFKKITNII